MRQTRNILSILRRRPRVYPWMNAEKKIKDNGALLLRRMFALFWKGWITLRSQMQKQFGEVGSFRRAHGFSRRAPFLSVVIILGVFISDGNANVLKDLYIQGEQAYQQGEYQKAIKIFEEVVELEPNFAAVYNALGLTHAAINTKLSDVIWLYNVAIDIDPKFIDAYTNKCRAFYKAGEYDKAEKSCLEALEVRPHYLSAQLSLAWVYLVGKEDPEKAIYYFKKVTQDIKEPMVYFGLGLAYSQNGDRVMVLDTVTQLRALDKDDLALKLEATIRTKDLPPIEDPFLPAPQRQPGQIISSKATGPAAPARAQQPAMGNLGTMQIRLRGTLSRGGKTTVESQPGTGEEQPKSAIDRIKELQRRRGITY